MDKIDQLIEEAYSKINKVNVRELRQELPQIFHRSFDTWIRYNGMYGKGEQAIKNFYNGELYDGNKKVDLSKYIPLGQNEPYILLYNRKTKKVQSWSHDPNIIHDETDTRGFNNMVYHLDDWFQRVKPEKKSSGLLPTKKFESQSEFEKRINTIFGMSMMVDDFDFKDYVNNSKHSGTDLRNYGVAIWPKKIEDFFKHAGTPAFKRKIKTINK